MCQAHRHLHLGQQAPPGRTAIQRHVRTRDPGGRRSNGCVRRPGTRENQGKTMGKPGENHDFSHDDHDFNLENLDFTWEKMDFALAKKTKT